MEEPAAALRSDPNDLISGFFRDLPLLAKSTQDGLKAPDRRYSPLPPEYDGRLFDLVVDQLITERQDAAERAW